ncbi:amidohydrolase family protein [Kalamiella sp. sgz302252]|uniref:amidohydrolase family protein n=1 Tax=Pantoea sp. sgz302252 TaxID=3341827 RepID=UPI0036D38130
MRSSLLFTLLCCLPSVQAAERPAALLIKNGYLISMQPGVDDAANSDVLIRNNTIIKTGKNLSEADAEVIDASGKYILPGFVDAHSHLWITTLRGQFRNKDGEFSPVSTKLGAKMQPQDIYTSIYSGAIELLAAGITASGDFFDNVRGPAWGDAGYKALSDSGIRAIMFYGGPDKTTKTPVDLQHMGSLLKSSSPRVSLGLAWRLPRDMQDQQNWAMRDREFRFAQENHLPVQVHVSGKPDAMFNALIERHYLTPFVTVIHATDAKPAQLAALEKAGGGLALTPISEQRVGYGLTRIDHFNNVKRLGLGLDGNALAGSADMFATMRLAALTQSGATKDESQPDPHRLLEMATLGGAQAIGLDKITGSIAPGKRADIQIIDPQALNMSGFGGGDPAALIVYSAGPQNVDTVIVDGQILKRNGKMLHIDSGKVVSEANASARRLLE